MPPDTEPRLFPLGTQQSGYASSDRDWIRKEVESGLRNHRGRLADAIENQAFFDLDGERYAPRREAETEFDFAGRPRRCSGFVQQVIESLCEHTYNPGPTRTVAGESAGMADSLLKQVYEDANIDCVMNHAEQLAALNDCAAIQVKATNDADKPIDLQIWGADEFTVFVDPDDPRKAYAAVTIDRYNQQTRYRLWFDDEVTTYLTDQWSPERTAGARIANQVGETEPNTYGCLPFAWMPYRAQVRAFWTAGIGTFLRKAELRINDRLSELDELIMKYGRPIGVFKNVGPSFTPEIGPGRFMRLVRGGTGYTGEGFAADGEPSAEYLQAQLAIEAIWVDLEKYIRTVCTAVRLPYSALELQWDDASSGIALVIKMAPLLSRARQRRPIYQLAEAGLAKTILTCAGNHYGHADLVSQAKTLQLLLAWAEPRIPVPGPDRDQADEWEMQMGIKSRIHVCSERYGLTRDQAVAHLKQVAEDEKEAQAMAPASRDEAPTPEPEQTDGDRP